MAIFRCRRSGNTIRVVDDNDLVKMRALESYEEVDNETETKETRQEDNETREVLSNFVMPDLTMNMVADRSLPINSKRGRPKTIRK